jgi:CRP/FNR family transcriptional regulator, cyclic AMP receptor protein
MDDGMMRLALSEAERCLEWGDVPVGAVQRRGRRMPKEELQRREKALMKAPLFSDLAKRHLRAIARVTGIAEFRPGTAVVKIGAPGRVFYVMLKGEAKVVSKAGRTVRRLKAGDFFGEISLLDGEPRSATVIAETPLWCLSLAGQDFREIMAQEPTLSIAIVRELASRLRTASSPLVG